jgi:hypothetical protein
VFFDVIRSSVYLAHNQKSRFAYLRNSAEKFRTSII